VERHDSIVNLHVAAITDPARDTAVEGPGPRDQAVVA
jgi:hypothetical protein